MANQEQTSLLWLDEEINASVFSDRRHVSRFRSLMQKLWRGMSNSLPFACQDSAATKAAYRFLASDKIDEQILLQGHTEATSLRIRLQKMRLFCSSRTPRHSAITGIILMPWDSQETTPQV